MIPVTRLPAPEELLDLLASGTDRVVAKGADSAAADSVWSSSRVAKREIRALLHLMAPAIQRCMYCLDSQGTDIDHFQPKALAPLRTFDWSNHLLACSFCNSNAKREEYPCDATTGKRLLVDPSTDDPADHLALLPASGTYDGLTAIGRESIRVFDLNRETLRRGRVRMFQLCRDLLPLWHAKLLRGDTTGADETAMALLEEPFGDVLRTLCRRARTPAIAELTYGLELGMALVEWRHAHT
ncbi:HNH endonuclease family protein [Streptomyces apricus]|uniref:HNH endonuclease n=1 Tax=Streptomyces apricus TaxID=1828112 RepID=A0A5B0B548_9ACTN|nr:HNH endonuclease [Streptomyces apricus]KAA0935789.1 HNH endonuclease [Streptomyces apricus]